MTDTVDQTPPTVTVEEDPSANDGTGGSAPLTVEMEEVNKPEEATADTVDTDDTAVNENNDVCLKKSVSFPEQENIACYSEAPDPWKNVTLWTTQDLVSYYKIGCDQNNVKPLSRVVTQLQNIDNPEQRYDLLSLKGEKLDIRHCESLEEIFKRVQFRCVDLEGCHLDDETAVALFDMIEFYESACKVNMSFNRNISLRGWQGCARMVRKTPCLTSLDARNCDLNERLVPVLGRALRMGCFLTTLHLESTYISGRPLVILVAALKTNETLKELFLADNRLVPTDGIQLGNLLKYNHKLSLLDIRNNHLQDIGIGHVCDGVFEQNLGTGLQTLVLWNNQITYSAMASIGNALSSTESLETLNLGHNNVTNEGIHLIKDGFLKSKSLLRMGLQGTKITCEGAVALAEVVADSPRLLRLDLRENDIKTAGLMALSLALKVNETVTRLDVDRDTKKESGMKDYADQQRRLQQDILNYLERNQQLSRKRIEEERIELERSIKEDTRPARSESIIEPVESGSGEFIQTFDKVKRPMLLVMQDKNAQQTLDSPYIHPEDISEVHSQGLARVVSPNIKSVISSSSPSAELLLSPQYSASVTAKKLFTVSRVEGQQLLNIPNKGGNTDRSSISSYSASPLLTPDDAGSLLSNSTISQPDSLNYPTSLSSQESPARAITENLQAETMNQMIEQLVGISVPVDDNNCETNDQNTDSFQNQQTSENESSADCKAPVTSDLEACKANEKNVTLTCTCNNSSQSQDQSHVNSNGNIAEGHPSVDTVCDKLSSDDLRNPSEQGKGDTCSVATSSSNNDSAMLKSGKDKENDVPQTCIENGIVESDSIKNKGDLEKNLPCEKVKKEEQSRDSGIGSYENEHWTSIGPEPHTENVKITGAHAGNPDFYSSLSFNGLTQELASALENLDNTDSNISSKECETTSAADDFERELDQMLADVKSGTNLNLPENLTS